MKKKQKTPNRNVILKYKIWLEQHNEPILGDGGARLLSEIDKRNSIAEAANRLKISYRFAWNYIKKIEKKTKNKIVKTKRGGAFGGKTTLTPFGKKLMRKYFQFKSHINTFFKIPDIWDAYTHISTEINKITGTVSKIQLSNKNITLEVEITKPHTIVALCADKGILDKISEGKQVKIYISPFSIFLSERDSYE